MGILLTFISRLPTMKLERALLARPAADHGEALPADAGRHLAKETGPVTESETTDSASACFHDLVARRRWIFPRVI